MAIRSAARRAVKHLADVPLRIRGRRRTHNAPHVLVAAPLPDNRGDEAMLVSAVAEFSHLGVDHLVIVETGPVPYSLEAPPAGMTVDVHRDEWVYFTSTETWSEERALKALVARARSVTFIGADVLDGTYGETRALQTIRLARFAASAGTPSQIVGFSVSDSMASSVAREYAVPTPSVRLCSRDGRSAARLRAAGATDVRLTADLAFLLEPVTAEDVLPPSPRGRRLAVCLHAGWTRGASDIAPLDDVAAAIEGVAERHGLDVVLISHHPRDYEVLIPLQARLGAAHLVPATLSAAQTKWLVGRCDHVLTSRMHIAVAALGMGRPVSCFPSGGKFHGLMEHFGLDPDVVCLTGAPDLDRHTVEAWLEKRVVAGETEAASVRDRVDGVRALARTNLALVASSGTT